MVINKRIGKDILIKWVVTTNGEAKPLVGRKLSLKMKTPKGDTIAMPFGVEGDNTIVFTYFGREQKVLGTYHIILWENLGEVGQTVVDKRTAFSLVASTDEECGSIDSNLTVGDVVNLDGSNIEVGVGGRDGVGVANIEVEESTESGGLNMVKITLTDGQVYVFALRNGKDGTLNYPTMRVNSSGHVIIRAQVDPNIRIKNGHLKIQI